MEQNKVTQPMLLNKELFKKLPYPNFLAYKFLDSHYRHYAASKKPAATLLKKINSKYGNSNVIVLLDGELVLNSVNGVEFVKSVSTQTNTKFDLLNETYKNSELKLRFTKSVLEPIQIVIAATRDTYHYANYEVCENVSVTMVEQFEFLKSAKLNYKVDVVAKNNANLELLYVEHLMNKKYNVIAHNLNAFKEANVTLNYINLNSASVVHTTNGFLLGEYSKIETHTLNIASNNYRLANLIRLEHLRKHTTSNIQNFGVVNHTAQLVIDGVGVIEKGFSKSAAEQETKIVNLTDVCKSVANPQLIINEYDVKAGHAAGVGRVDEESLYYLMSRGLSKHESIELLIMSHATCFLNKITNKKQLKYVLKTIKNKLI